LLSKYPQSGLQATKDCRQAGIGGLLNEIKLFSKVNL
jgi:hypothetical protein